MNFSQKKQLFIRQFQNGDPKQEIIASCCNKSKDKHTLSQKI